MKSTHLHIKEIDNKLYLRGRLNATNIKVIQLRVNVLFGISEQLILDITGLKYIEPEVIYSLQKLKAEARLSNKRLFLMSAKNKRLEKSFRILEMESLIDLYA